MEENIKNEAELEKQANEPPKRSKLRLVVCIVAVILLVAFAGYATVSKVNSHKKLTDENGYTGYEYSDGLKVSFDSADECTIDGSTYRLITEARTGYAVENKGRYNEYGLFFGDEPELYMMNYDQTNTEFWFAKNLLKYPEISNSKITALIIPDSDYQIFGNDETGIVRIDFGTSPQTIKDGSTINEAVSEYKEAHSFSYSTNTVEAGTPIYASFESSCLYFKIGTTIEE